MPGPSNLKKRRKSYAKSVKKQKAGELPQPGPNVTRQRTMSYDSTTPPSRSPSHLLTPPNQTTFLEYVLPPEKIEVGVGEPDDYYDTSWDGGLVPQTPFIHDPGNGPRVRDTKAFLNSSFFSQPAALEDPLCAEFAQEEILEMLGTILPEETAMILWYNKSRITSRICPACQRLYRLGDILPDLMDGVEESVEKRPSPQLDREQEISGLCSPVCFILASFNYPGAIKSAWGRMADEMDETTWALLNGPGEGKTQGGVSSGLEMLVKMTRLHDLGLAQLCLGDESPYADDCASDVD